MSPVTSILITGANVGLGKECSQQLALMDGVKKIYLGCRSQSKADEAKKDLEESTQKKIFEVLIIDVSDLESVRKAVANLKEPIDGLVLNAGGQGGADFAAVTAYGVTRITAVNLLGHVLLVDLLLEQKKLTGSVVYAGSEVARGAPAFGLARPKINGSEEEFVSICDGSFSKKKDFDSMYGPVKLLAAMWTASMARKYPAVRFITISPGATTGTAVMRDLGPVKKMFFKTMFVILGLFGSVHPVEVGAKRYVDALTDDDTYKTGVFYASKKGTSGPVCDQASLMEELKNEQYQDNANAAIHTFIK